MYGAGIFPMLPPPPPSEPPAVPVRRAVARVAGIQTLGRRPPAHLPVSSAAAYIDSDSSDTPRFLMHTASGNVFIPPGKCMTIILVERSSPNFFGFGYHDRTFYGISNKILINIDISELMNQC